MFHPMYGGKFHNYIWCTMAALKCIFYSCLCIQENEENPSLLLSSSAPRRLIHPGSSEKFYVCLPAKTVGKLHSTLWIAVFSSLQPYLVSGSVCAKYVWYLNKDIIFILWSLIISVLFQEVALSCIGQGPVVHIRSTQLSFGKIPVLKSIAKTLHLYTQSPIPAHFY